MQESLAMMPLMLTLFVMERMPVNLANIIADREIARCHVLHPGIVSI